MMAFQRINPPDVKRVRTSEPASIGRPELTLPPPHLMVDHRQQSSSHILGVVAPPEFDHDASNFARPPSAGAFSHPPHRLHDPLTSAPISRPPVSHATHMPPTHTPHHSVPPRYEMPAESSPPVDMKEQVRRQLERQAYEEKLRRTEKERARSRRRRQERKEQLALEQLKKSTEGQTNKTPDVVRKHTSKTSDSVSETSAFCPNCKQGPSSHITADQYSEQMDVLNLHSQLLTRLVYEAHRSKEPVSHAVELKPDDTVTVPISLLFPTDELLKCSIKAIKTKLSPFVDPKPLQPALPIDDLKKQRIPIAVETPIDSRLVPVFASMRKETLLKCVVQTLNEEVFPVLLTPKQCSVPTCKTILVTNSTKVDVSAPDVHSVLLVRFEITVENM